MTDAEEGRTPAARGGARTLARGCDRWKGPVPGDNEDVGFNPLRAQKRRSSDYLFLAAALAVTLLLLLWAFNP